MQMSHFSPTNVWDIPLSKYPHIASTGTCWKIVRYIDLWANAAQLLLCSHICQGIPFVLLQYFSNQAIIIQTYF